MSKWMKIWSLILTAVFFTSTNIAQIGSNCSNPNNLLSLPFAQTGMTTCGFISDYSPADACASVYMAGEDYVFSYTPAVNSGIDVLMSNSSALAGLFILDGCPNAPGTNCIASFEGFNPTLECIALTGGTTYYIIVSSAPFLPPPPLPPILCAAFDITIQESPGGGAPPSCNLDYSISNISHSPVSYATGTNLVFSDDYFSPTWINFGFNFCFDGVLYNNCLISSNGYITFPGCYGSVPGGDPNPGGYSPWSITAAAPNSTNCPGNSIMLTWQDINPNSGGNILYETVGTSPNQVFIVKYDNIPLYGCATSLFSGQLMLYETSNLIEFHITEKTTCAGWNGGAGIMGLNNYDGTLATIVTGHNYPGSWAETNTGYRFTPNCTGAICSIALPIHLSNFQGEALSRSNLISWTTETETNNDYFILEKSTGGAEYYEIARIEGAGTTAQANTYEFQDYDLGSNLCYYRLKQVDFDGVETISSTISVEREPSFNVNFYPNPTEEGVNAVIELSDLTVCTIQISSILGIAEEFVVQLPSGTSTIELETFRQLAQGIYSVNIINAMGQIIASDKVIKK